MKHKEKECTWAPGMQDTDVTFAGDHAWATILRAQGRESGKSSARQKLLVLLGLGVVLGAAWFLV